MNKLGTALVELLNIAKVCCALEDVSRSMSSTPIILYFDEMRTDINGPGHWKVS